MKIKLVTPGSAYKTEIDTEGCVIIENPYVGPVLTNGDLCVSIFARDDVFEGHIWRGDPDPSAPLPAEAMLITITPQGVDVRKRT